MCIVSMIGDNFQQKFPKEYPQVYPYVQPYIEKDIDKFVQPFLREEIKSLHSEEMERLRKELEALKKMLKAAKIYDEETGQKDCEQASKVAHIKAIMELCGVEPEELFD